MAQERFGGVHTDRKLAILAQYLDRYTTALKNQHFETIYVDAFAGTGAILVSEEDSLPLGTDVNIQPLIRGSAVRALELSTPFDRYVFVEKKSAKLRELKLLGKQYPNLTDRMSFRREDANQAVSDICRSEN